MLLPGLFVFVGERQRNSGFSEIVPSLGQGNLSWHRKVCPPEDAFYAVVNRGLGTLVIDGDGPRPLVPSGARPSRSRNRPSTK